MQTRTSGRNITWNPDGQGRNTADSLMVRRGFGKAAECGTLAEPHREGIHLPCRSLHCDEEEPWATRKLHEFDDKPCRML